MVIKELFLVIGALVIFRCLAKEIKLKNGVIVNHVKNELGDFLNIYDYKIDIVGFDATIVKHSKIECRWIQMAISAKIASVGPRIAAADGFECRTHNLTLGKTKLRKAEGWTTFLAVPEDSYFSPQDGLFYTRPTDPKYPNCCLNNGIELMPIARTENQKERLAQYMESTNNGYPWAYLGAHFEDSGKIFWHDTSPLDTLEDLFQCNLSPHVALFERINKAVFIYACQPWYPLMCICTTNIFGLPWVD